MTPAATIPIVFNQRLLRHYDLEDTLSDLRRALEATFRDVQIEVIGCVAQFAGRA